MGQFDFGEETLSRSGTTHSTNGIIIQRSTDKQHQQQSLPSLKKTKKRPLDAPGTHLEPFFRTVREKDGPTPVAVDTNVEVDLHQNARDGPTKLDMGFFLTRQAVDDNQVPIPSWTGFNTQLTDHIPPLSKVGYLAVIDASPTKMDTVKTILHRRLQYADTKM